MAPEPDELVVAKVIAAFARTGLEPISGERAWKPDDVDGPPTCACAVGAVAIDQRRSPDYNALGKDYACVEFGWDDVFDANIHTREGRCACGDIECMFYEAGAAAAIAMGAA
jgi:hypothetical protein